MNYKNKLQEYCQKNKLKLPLYYTFACDTGFVSTVTVNGKKFKGTQTSTKKGAEKSAAEVACKNINIRFVDLSKKSTDRTKIELINHTTFIIDVENKPNVLTKLIDEFEFIGEYVIYAVASIHHPVIENYRDDKNILNNKNVILHDVPSTRKNGADVGMCVLAGQLMDNDNPTFFVLISGDKFIDALNDCLVGYNFSSVVCRSEKQLIKQLENL